MGLAVYYYPTADGPLKKISAERDPRDLVEDGVQVSAWTQAAGGTPYVARRSDLRRIRIQLSVAGVDRTAEVQEWEALINHLRRGGFCGVSRTAARAWAGLTTGSVTGGDTSLVTGGNAFSAWAPSATLSSSYPVRLESGPSGGDIAETCAVSTYSVPTVTLSTAARFTYPGHVLVRDPDFWPVCYLDESQGDGLRISSATRRLTWMLEGVLVYSPALTIAVAAGGSADGIDLGGRVETETSTPNLSDDTAAQWGVEGGGSGLSLESAYRQIRRPRLTRAWPSFARIPV